MTKTKTLSDRMHEIGLPYEITEVNAQFLLSGGDAVVACWKNGASFKMFAGFNHEGLARDLMVSRAREMHGVFAVYVVTSEEQES